MQQYKIGKMNHHSIVCVVGMNIISFSGGKDSCATVILAHQNHIPIDAIVFSEVLFDKGVSGEWPEHLTFIKEVCFPTFEKWGYPCMVLHSDKTYLDFFYQRRKKGKNEGKRIGFPMADCCNVKYCKLQPMKAYLQAVKKQDTDFVEYVGIAIDEPNRLQRLKNHKNKKSLLEQFQYTEEMAKNLCLQYDLLSPIYSHAKRSGCWFCPNQTIEQLRFLYTTRKDLWEKLEELEQEENLVGKKFHSRANQSIRDYRKRFQMEEHCGMTKQRGQINGQFSLFQLLNVI